MNDKSVYEKTEEKLDKILATINKIGFHSIKAKKKMAQFLF